MADKQNCWEIRECGREPGGRNVTEEGPCCAAVHRESDGLNGGTNGGRICWTLAGTFCPDRVEGTFARRLLACFGCEVFRRVKQEEGASFHFQNGHARASNATPRQRSGN